MLVVDAVQAQRAELRRRARRVGVTIGEVLHHSDKALVARGHDRHGPVVAKLLVSDDPFWRLRRAHEAALYRRFEVHPPPVTVPRMVHDDGERLMVLTELPGQPLHDQRYLDRDLDPTTVSAVLQAVADLAGWHPAPPLPAPIADYTGRVDAEHAAGLVDDADRAALYRLLGRIGETRVTAHGDPLPTNLLLADGGCGLVDLEFCGSYIPGHDMALLDTVAGSASPTVRAAITATVVADHELTDGYTASLALVIAREIRIHRALPDTSRRVHRLALLAGEWRRARRLLHAAAGTGVPTPTT